MVSRCYISNFFHLTGKKYLFREANSSRGKLWALRNGYCPRANIRAKFLSQKGGIVLIIHAMFFATHGTFWKLENITRIFVKNIHCFCRAFVKKKEADSHSTELIGYQTQAAASIHWISQSVTEFSCIITASNNLPTVLRSGLLEDKYSRFIKSRHTFVPQCLGNILAKFHEDLSFLHSGQY